MKKTIAIIMTAAMLFMQLPAVLAEDNSMEKALIAVKGKIDIPSYLTEFETGSFERNGGKLQYSFSWRSEEKENNIYIHSDGEGRIASFSEYNPEWNNSGDGMRIDTSFSIEAAEEFAKTWLKKAAPELYKDGDSPEAQGFGGTLNPRSNRYHFSFERIKDGIAVKGNSASVTVVKGEDGFDVSDAYISWDYDALFSVNSSDIGIEAAEKLMSQQLPMRLIYRKTYEDKYLLEYVSDGIVYINAEEGKKEEEDKGDDEIFAAQKEMSADTANVVASAGGGGEVRLTEAEISELDKTRALKSTDELFNMLVNMPELGVFESLRPLARNNTYKTKDGYMTRLSAYEEKSEKNKNKYTSVNATFNAQTGELLNFHRYSSDGRDYERNAQQQEKAYDFLEKYFADKVNNCDKKLEESRVMCRRIVNSIPYENNYITSSVNAETGYVESFNMAWDDDITKLPPADNIITNEEALKARYERYPLEKLYVKSGGEYKVMYTLQEYTVRINAINGEAVNYLGEKDEKKANGEYSDIEGHWVEDIVKTLAKYNIYIEGDELKPDTCITQAEFLTLVLNGVCGEFYKPEAAELYKSLERRKIVTKEERASQQSLTREDAIRYLLRAMGIGEVAEIKGIYVCDFKDGDMISPDRIGYCAIAKGYKIIGGSDGMLLPKANTTRAEALAMIYNYLTR